MASGADSFLQSVVRSGLLDKDELEGALRVVPEREKENADRLAQCLIQLGKLTRFQARKLLQGATLGLVLGPYHLLTPLGRGGMGCVYLALDARSGKHVAIKVLPPKKARAQERMVARFQREMSLSQRVNHPHLARTLETGVWQGVNYIIMEYIPGQSLHRLVMGKGVLNPGLAALLFSEVASALEHAHEVGLIHRDLKPSNIMVTPRDHAKVLDLGLALMQGEVGDLEVIGGKGYVVGSADYMAPEQTYDATQVDARTDVYALGCTLYFALGGAPPFSGGTAKEKMQAHRHKEASPLQWRNPEVPDALAERINRMMAKKPAERLPDMAAVREALKPWCNPVQNEPVGPEEDASFQSVLAEVEKTTVPESLADIPILRTDLAGLTGKPEVKVEGQDSPSGLPPPHPEAMAMAEITRRVNELRRIGFFVAGLCGVLVVLLAVLLFFVFRG